MRTIVNASSLTSRQVTMLKPARHSTQTATQRPQLQAPPSFKVKYGVHAPTLLQSSAQYQQHLAYAVMPSEICPQPHQTPSLHCSPSLHSSDLTWRCARSGSDQRWHGMTCSNRRNSAAAASKLLKTSDAPGITYCACYVISQHVAACTTTLICSQLAGSNINSYSKQAAHGASSLHWWLPSHFWCWVPPSMHIQQSTMDRST
jgi:hypothetical protein